MYCLLKPIHVQESKIFSLMQNRVSFDDQIYIKCLKHYVFLLEIISNFMVHYSISCDYIKVDMTTIHVPALMERVMLHILIRYSDFTHTD